MSRKSIIAFGPGAASLILIVVILSMSVLGILALMNARSDQRLSQRSVEVVESGYLLNDKAERRLAALDAVAAECAKLAHTEEEYLNALRGRLPEGMLMDGREISWTETDGFRTLECVVELALLGESERVVWRVHRLTAVTEGLWN